MLLCEPPNTKCFHTESGRFDFTKALLFVALTTSLGSRPSDAPHAGLVCPYNSEAGGSGYEVLKYSMMAKQYNNFCKPT